MRSEHNHGLARLWFSALKTESPAPGKKSSQVPATPREIFT
jgi:hypothetical protein